jgi:signal transduction histidine kinase
VANAVKFTPAGGAVTVSAESRGERLQVTVSDTGVGISDTTLARLFSVGERTSTPGTAGETGTGLDLPICKEMVERNGGRIWAVSVAGEGSRFHSTLPFSAANQTGRQDTSAAA